MFSQKNKKTVYIDELPHIPQLLVADANIPYKICINRRSNTMYFCINADEASDNSFHSVVYELNTKQVSIIPGIRDGFASAVNQSTGDVYLGGSQGIYKYNPITRDVDRPPLLPGVDIFDMYYKHDIYFVDTMNQNLYILKDHAKDLVKKMRNHFVYHFVIDDHGNIYFVSSNGLFVYRKYEKIPVLLDDRDINYRGATTDIYGNPHFIAQDGIYRIDKNDQLLKILSIEHGYGLAFDKHNHIIYSNGRSIIKLIPCE